ncbi:NUDIX domain-containing protein [Paraconexibacter sp.]|uniref:NUDIX domain-containing protein n=1 Tax=Paraconexibacter sp. TaxID=2949640 RepID=UPI003568513E
MSGAVRRPRTSAGLLPYRVAPDGQVEVLIAHMGGPFWARKDERAWSIVKGEYDPTVEDPLDAARREFCEETGFAVPAGAPRPLGEVRQSGGKTVVAWAVEADLDPGALTPGTFTMEWPPRSGRQQEFPEIDRVAWVDPDGARAKLVSGQVPLVDRLLDVLRDG